MQDKPIILQHLSKKDDNFSPDKKLSSKKCDTLNLVQVSHSDIIINYTHYCREICLSKQIEMIKQMIEII